MPAAARSFRPAENLPLDGRQGPLSSRHAAANCPFPLIFLTDLVGSPSERGGPSCMWTTGSMLA